MGDDKNTKNLEWPGLEETLLLWPSMAQYYLPVKAGKALSQAAEYFAAIDTEILRRMVTLGKEAVYLALEDKKPESVDESVARLREAYEAAPEASQAKAFHCSKIAALALGQFDRIAALLEDIEVQRLLHFLQFDLIRQKAIECGCTIFNNKEAAERAKENWKARILSLKAAQEEVFWNWAHGTFPDSIKGQLCSITWEIPGDKDALTFPNPEDFGEYSLVVEAAIEGKKKMESLRSVVLALRSLGIFEQTKFRMPSKTKSFYRSCLRDAVYQNTKYKGKYNHLEKEEQQKKTLEERSAPLTSRHHWATDYDICKINNEVFTEGKRYHGVYQWLSCFGKHFGFLQTYTGKGIGHIRPTAVNWKRVEEELDEDGVPLYKLVDFPDADVRGYEEERWHWSYWPVAEALLEILRESNNMKESHRIKVEIWQGRKEISGGQCDKSAQVGKFLAEHYTYPIKFWPDYVFNVNPIMDFDEYGC